MKQKSLPAVRVGITGSYGGMNLGDEAILESIVEQIRRDVPAEITVFSRDVEDTRQRHAIDRAVPIRDLSRADARAEVGRLDVLIFGGGGILFDAEAEIFLREVMLAHEVGVPVLVYAVSAGPLDDGGARALVREALESVAVLTVRDRLGARLLEEIGIRREIHITADPALLLGPDPLPPDALAQEGLDPTARLIGISVREPGPAAPSLDVAHYHALIANAADFMVDRLDAQVVFVPIERKRMDLRHAHAVVSQMQEAARATVLKGEYTSRQCIDFVSHFEFVLGMRLHFLIFAALAHVPFVALPYAPKVAGLLEDLGMEMPPLHDVTTGRLLATIDRSWDFREEIRGQIHRLLPGLQERARDTHSRLLDLLRRRSGRSRTSA